MESRLASLTTGFSFSRVFCLWYKVVLYNKFDDENRCLYHVSYHLLFKEWQWCGLPGRMRICRQGTGIGSKLLEAAWRSLLHSNMFLASV